MPGGRGGRRTGRPGAKYDNRTDLQNGARPTVPTGQPYGQAAQQQAVVDATPAGRSLGAAPEGAGTVSFPAPGSLGPIDRPTERPDEPLTAGAPFGPGPGPEVLMVPGDDPDMDELRVLYQRYPNEELRQIIEELEAGDL